MPWADRCAMTIRRSAAPGNYARAAAGPRRRMTPPYSTPHPPTEPRHASVPSCSRARDHVERPSGRRRDHRTHAGRRTPGSGHPHSRCCSPNTLEAAQKSTMRGAARQRSPSGQDASNNEAFAAISPGGTMFDERFPPAPRPVMDPEQCPASRRRRPRRRRVDGSKQDHEPKRLERHTPRTARLTASGTLDSPRSNRGTSRHAAKIRLSNASSSC